MGVGCLVSTPPATVLLTFMVVEMIKPELQGPEAVGEESREKR